MTNILSGFHASGLIFIYFLIRIWSMCLSRAMLNVILRSGTGKQSAEYKKHATFLQRLYGTYTPSVTRYRQKLAKYLAWNNASSGCATAAVTALFIAGTAGLDIFSTITAYTIVIAILLLCLPPIIISFVQTSYNGGHPHYRFDLESDFIGSAALLRKKALLNEKRNSLIMTPEEFSAKNSKSASRNS